MKCNNCNFETEQDFVYCPNCGAAHTENSNSETNFETAEPVSITPAADRILSVLKDNLFLAVCILVSASAVLSILSATLPVLSILFTIFLWLVYAGGKKGIADAKYLRYVSGTVFAGYVINFVLAGLIIFAGLLCGLIFGALGSSSLFDDILSQTEFSGLAGLFISASGVVLFFLFAAIGAAYLVLNLLGMRKIHSLAKTTYQSIDCGVLNLPDANSARVWLLVFGICTAVTALFSLAGDATAALSSGCDAAAMIISSVLINKYLKPQQF